MRRERHARTARRTTQPYHVFASRDDFFRHRLSTAGGASLPSPESAEPDSSRKPRPQQTLAADSLAKRASPTARLHRAGRDGRARRPGRAGRAGRVCPDGRDGTASTRAAAGGGASSAPRDIRPGNYQTLLRPGKTRSAPARPQAAPTAGVIDLKLPYDRGPEHRRMESYTASACTGRLQGEAPGCDPTARARFAPADGRRVFTTPRYTATSCSIAASRRRAVCRRRLMVPSGTLNSSLICRTVCESR